MTAILDVALPFFLVIALGYEFCRRGLAVPGSIRGLNAFVFYIALPALLIGALAKAPVERLLDWRFLVVFYGASVIIYAATIGLSLARGSSLPESALRALAAVWGNWGYMGIPLLLAAFGPEGALVAVLAMLGDTLVTSPLTIALVEIGRSGKGGLAAARQAIRGVARNPLVLAATCGFSIAAFDLTLPTALDRFLGFVGAAASPCALFALGVSLFGVPISTGRLDTLLVSAARLVLHPGLVWLASVWILPLPPDIARAAVVTAALPTAASAFVLAQRYDTFVLRASTIVLVTHLLSVLTLSALLARFVG